MYVNTLNGYHLQKENHKIYKKKKKNEGDCKNENEGWIAEA